MSNISHDTRQRLLRVFFSADMAGSTRFKGANPVGSSVLGVRASHNWATVFASFFEDFSREFMARDREVRASNGESVHNPVRIWKINGDEILFAADIDSTDQVIFQTRAFSETVALFDDRLLKSYGLGVRGCCWTAGFPVRNRAIRLNSISIPHVHMESAEVPLDELLYFRQGLGFVEDYIGVEIDQGFRLAGLARPGRLIISIDVASILAESAPIGSPLRFFLVGWSPLKGVYGDSPYPLVWVDFLPEGSVRRPRNVVEEAESSYSRTFLNDECGFSRERMKNLCDAYLVETERFRIRPYIQAADMASDHSRIHKTNPELRLSSPIRVGGVP